MVSLFFAWAAGLLFGFGLIISGMANPEKVLGFLNITGPWDISLLFVMASAIAIAIPAFQWAKSAQKSLLGLALHLPQIQSIAQLIDPRLILGSVIFGIGWGLVGLCPGPALVALGSGSISALYFIVAMLVGMLVGSFAIDALNTRKP